MANDIPNYSENKKLTEKKLNKRFLEFLRNQERINENNSARLKIWKEYHEFISKYVEKPTYIILPKFQKEPFTKLGFSREDTITQDVEEVKEGLLRGYNLGLVVPRELTVIDIDVPYKTRNGKTNPIVKHIQKILGLKLKDTFVILSRKKGIHIYTLSTNKTSLGQKKKERIVKEQIDVIGSNNSYVVVPPSIVPVEPEKVPNWLYEKIGNEPQQYKILNKTTIVKVPKERIEELKRWRTNYFLKLNSFVQFIVKFFNLNYKPEKKIYHISCPFHPPDKHPSMVIDFHEFVIYDNHDGKVYTFQEFVNELKKQNLIPNELKNDINTLFLNIKDQEKGTNKEIKEDLLDLIKGKQFFYMKNHAYMWFDDIKRWKKVKFEEIGIPRKFKEQFISYVSQLPKPKFLDWRFWLQLGSTLIHLPTLKLLHSTPDYYCKTFINSNLSFDTINDFIKSVNGINWNELITRFKTQAPQTNALFMLLSPLDYQKFYSLLGGIISPIQVPQRIYFLYDTGDGNSGKSFFVNIFLPKLIGEKFITDFDLSINSRFESSRFDGKLIGKYEEHGATTLTEEQIATLRKIASFGIRRVEEKGIQLHEYSNTKWSPNIILVTNGLPSAKEGFGKALLRRCQLIKFVNNFSNSPQPRIIEKIERIVDDERDFILLYSLIFAYIQYNSSRLLYQEVRKDGTIDHSTILKRFLLSDEVIKWLNENFGVCFGCFIPIQTLKSFAVINNIKWNSRYISFLVNETVINKERIRTEKGRVWTLKNLWFKKETLEQFEEHGFEVDWSCDPCNIVDYSQLLPIIPPQTENKYWKPQKVEIKEIKDEELSKDYWKVINEGIKNGVLQISNEGEELISKLEKVDQMDHWSAGMTILNSKEKNNSGNNKKVLHVNSGVNPETTGPLGPDNQKQALISLGKALSQGKRPKTKPLIDKNSFFITSELKKELFKVISLSKKFSFKVDNNKHILTFYLKNSVEYPIPVKNFSNLTEEQIYLLLGLAYLDYTPTLKSTPKTKVVIPHQHHKHKENEKKRRLRRGAGEYTGEELLNENIGKPVILSQEATKNVVRKE